MVTSQPNIFQAQQYNDIFQQPVTTPVSIGLPEHPEDFRTAARGGILNEEAEAIIKRRNAEVQQRAELRKNMAAGGAEFSSREFDLLYEGRKNGHLNDDDIYKMAFSREMGAYLGISTPFVFDHYDAAWQLVAGDWADRYAAPQARLESFRNSIQIAKNNNPMGLMGDELMGLNMQLDGIIETDNVKNYLQMDQGNTELGEAWDKLTPEEQHAADLLKKRNDLLESIAELRTANEKLGRGMPTDPFSFIVNSTIQSSPATFKAIAGGLIGGGIGAGIGALVGLAGYAPGVAVGASSGANIGFRAGSFAASATEMTGLLYIDLIAAGVEESTARGLAVVGGTVNGVIEAGLGTVWKFGKAAGKSIGGAMLGKEAQKAIADAAAKGFIGKITQSGMAATLGKNVVLKTAFSIAKEAGEEGVEELLQYMVEQGMLALGDAMQDAPVDRNLWGSREFKDEMWQSMLGGFAGGLGFGIAGTVSGPVMKLPLRGLQTIRETVQETKHLKNLAITIDDKAEYGAAAGQSPMLAHLDPEEKQAAIDTMYESQESERLAYHQWMREEAERAGHKTAAMPTLEAPGPMRVQADGRLQTRITQPAPEQGSGSGTLAIADPPTGQRMGTMKYHLDVESSTISIRGINLSKAITNTEATIGSMIKELAYANPDVTIELNPTEKMSKAAGVDLAALKNNLIAENPRGADWKLQFYRKGDRFDQSRAMNENIGLLMKAGKTGREQAQNFLSAIEPAHRHLGVNISEFIRTVTSETDLRADAQADPEGVKARIAEKLDQGRIAAQTVNEEPAGAFVIIKRGENGQPDQIVTGREALNEAMDRLSAVTVLTDASNPSTLYHEWMHYMAGVVIPNSPRYRALLEQAFGKKLEEFTAADHEKLAEQWTHYLKKGEAPTPGLKALFKRIAEALRQFVASMHVSPQLRQFFDALLAGPDGAMMNSQNRQEQRQQSRVRVQVDNEQQQAYAQMTETERVLQSDLHTREEKAAARQAAAAGDPVSSYNAWAVNPSAELPAGLAYVKEAPRRRLAQTLTESDAETQWVMSTAGGERLLFPNPRALDQTSDMGDLYVFDSSRLGPKGQNAVQITEPCRMMPGSNMINAPGRMEVMPAGGNPAVLFAMVKQLAEDVSEEPAETRNTPSKPWAESFPPVTHFIDTENKLAKPWKELAAHPDYDQAKNHENREAAVRLVRDFLKGEEQQQQIRRLAETHPDAIVVPVHAVEEHSRNRIPSALAGYISNQANLELNENIIQTNKVSRTGKETWYRFAFRPKFEGEVKQGRKYILVDDVFSNGGAFSELRRYIELNGGEVVAMAAMATGGHGEAIALTEQTRLDLEKKFGVELLQQFLQEEGLYGGNYQSITEPEGYALLRAETLDEARNRIAEARQEGRRSLLPGSLQRSQGNISSQEINTPNSNNNSIQTESAKNAQEGRETGREGNDTAGGDQSAQRGAVGPSEANSVRLREEQKYKNDLQQVKSGALNPGSLIQAGSAPDIYARKGLPNFNILLPASVIGKATQSKHKVGMDIIERLPELLNSPVMILKSLTDPKAFITVIDAVDSNGDTIIVSQKPTLKRITTISSIYGKENFDNFIGNCIKQDKVIAADKNKAARHVRPHELQLLKGTLLDDLSSKTYDTSWNLSSPDAEDSGILFQRAWQGSPHLFEKYDLSKIGTGEGNLSFGWGAYFAGKKEVAEHYRKTLGYLAGAEFYVDGVKADAGDDWAIFRWAEEGKLDEFIAHFEKILADIKDDKPVLKAEYADWLQRVENAEHAIQKARELQGKKVEQKGGHLYEADIPGDEELLDWDKPLSGQPEQVKESLKKLFAGEMKESHSGVPEYDGEKLYKEITFEGRMKGSANPEKWASLKLNEYGIKGIRFLDGSSRKAGEGTHNYVIFDDSEIEITDILFQMTREQIRAEALQHDSPEEWMKHDEFVEAVTMGEDPAAFRRDDASEEPQTDEDKKAWYEKQWNEAKVLEREASLGDDGVRIAANAEAVDPGLLEDGGAIDGEAINMDWLEIDEEEKPAVPPESGTIAPESGTAPAYEDVPITTSEANRRLIAKLPKVIDRFLSGMGGVMRMNLAHYGAITAEDAQARDRLERDQRRIRDEAQNYIQAIALRASTGKVITDTQRQSVMTRITRSLESGATVYRELYTSLTEDPEFASYAKNEVRDSGAQGEAQQAAADAHGLTEFQRTKLAEKIIDKKLARRIHAAKATQEEIEDYIRRRNEDIRNQAAEIQAQKELVEKAKGETAEECAELDRWFRLYQKERLALKTANKELEVLEQKLEKARTSRTNMADRMRSGRQRSEAKLREQIAGKREEIKTLHKKVKEQHAYGLKKGRLEVAHRWAQERKKLAEMEAGRKQREEDRKAAAKYLEECRKAASWNMSADRTGGKLWVRQRELILGIQNALFDVSKDAYRAQYYDNEIKKFEKKLAAMKKRLAAEKAGGETAGAREAESRKRIERFEARLERLQANKQYELVKETAKKLERERRRLEKTERGDPETDTEWQIENLEKTLEDLRSKRRHVEVLAPDLGGMETDKEGPGPDSIDTGTIMIKGQPVSVEQFRKDFFEGKIRYGFMDSRLRKAFSKAAPPAFKGQYSERANGLAQGEMAKDNIPIPRSLGEKRKWSAAKLSKSMSLEDLLAVKATIQQLSCEGKANWERRQFAVHFRQQEKIKLLLSEQDELLEEGKVGAAKRHKKAMASNSIEEQKKILSKGEKFRQTAFATLDDNRLVQSMDGHKKRALYDLLIRDSLKYERRRDMAVEQRTGRIIELIGLGTAEEQAAEKDMSEHKRQRKREKRADDEMKKLGKKDIVIEGIGPRKMSRKWELDAGFRLRAAETLLGPKTRMELSLADLMFLSVALENKYTRAHYLYGNLWSKDEQAYYEQFLRADGTLPRDVLAEIESIGKEKENAIKAAIKERLMPRQDLLKIVKAIQEDFNAHFPETRAVFEEMFNQSVEPQENYLPSIINEGKHDNAEKQDEIVALTRGSKQVRINPDKGSMLARVDIGPTHQSAIETDIFKVFFKGVEQEEHFAKFAPYIRDLNTVLRGRNNNSRQLAEHLTDLHGKWMLDRMYQQVNMVGLPPSAKQRDSWDNAALGLGRMLAGNASVAYIAGNIPAWIAQYPYSIAGFFGKADAKLLLASCFELMKPGNDLVARVFEKSPKVKRRVMNQADEYRRWLAEQPEEWKQAHAKVIEVMMTGQRHADQTMVSAGWWALYQTALKEGKGEEDAALYADEVVEETQPDMSSPRRGPLYKDEGLGKLFLRFSRPQNMIWQNLTYDSVISREKSLGGTIARVAAYGIAALIVAAIRGGLAKEDGEDIEPDELTRRVFYYLLFSNIFESMPLVGTTASGVVERLITGDGYLFQERQFELTYRIGNSLMRLSSGKYEAAIKDALHALGLGAGLPVSQTKRIMRAVQKQNPWIVFGYDPR